MTEAAEAVRAGAKATIERIERYLGRLMQGVETEEQYTAACRRAWRYYHRLKREDRDLMLALMVQMTLSHYCSFRPWRRRNP